jgi:anti-anti-sigma factor
MVVVKPTWNLDVAGAQRLEEVIQPLDGMVLVDLSAVAFVASSGLRVLLKHAQRLKNGAGALRLCGANDTVNDVFRMSGFDSIIEIYGECEDVQG